MKEISYCANCVTPNTRPGISFDEKGFCNGCQWALKKRTIDWDQRLISLKEKIRKKVAIGQEKRDYDCVREHDKRGGQNKTKRKREQKR